MKNAKTKIIIIAAIVAALAAFLANANTIISVFKDLFNKQGIELVNVSFINNDSLDIKVRNTSDEISILKKIELTIKNKWLIVPEETSKGFLPASATYDIQVDTAMEVGAVLTKEISQEVAPGKSDRFILHIGPLQKNIYGSYVFSADLAIICDEDNKKIIKKNILIALIDNTSIYEINAADPGRVSDQNSATISEIENYSGIKSKELNDFILALKEK